MLITIKWKPPYSSGIRHTALSGVHCTPPIVVIHESGLTIIELELELGSIPRTACRGHTIIAASASSDNLLL